MCTITVTDSSQPNHLLEELTSMRDAGDLFDYVIKGNTETFHIHSLVLASVSDVFKAMLRSNMEESTKKETAFPSIPDDIMTKVIDYAYTGTCTVSEDQLMNLIKAAHYLQMSKLVKLSETKIATVLNPSNCFSWLHIAEKLQLNTVMPEIQNMMWASNKDVISAEEFKEANITDLKQYVIDAQESGIHNDDLLHVVLEWVNHDTVNRSMHMQELFEMVPFYKCSEQFILRIMTNYSELLSSQANIFKLMLSDVLTNQLSKKLGKGTTFIILGGVSYSNTPNTHSWMLEDDKILPFCQLSEDFEIKPFHSVCQIPGGMMISGGNSTNECIVFLALEKQWVKQEPMPIARHSHSSCFNTGKVFMVGGTVRYELTHTMDYLDMKSNTWSHGPDIPQVHYFPKVVSLNKVLFVLLSTTCEMYQLDTDKMSWSLKAPLPQASFGCSLAASGGRIFAAGGDNNINYMYMPTTNAWCCLTGPTLTERHGSLICHQHKLYLFGGCKRDQHLTDIEKYDITADKWSLTKWKLPIPLWLHGAFIVDTPPK